MKDVCPTQTSRNQVVGRKDNSFWKGVMFATFLEMNVESWENKQKPSFS